MICDSVKATGAATGNFVQSGWRKRFQCLERFLNYGSCHNVFNLSKELSPQENCSFSELSKVKRLKPITGVSFILADEMTRIKF